MIGSIAAYVQAHRLRLGVILGVLVTLAVVATIHRLHRSGPDGAPFVLAGLGICKSSAAAPPPAREQAIEAQPGEGRTIGLATQYQPTLVVARADRNWPVSVQAVLSLRYGSVGTCLFSGRVSGAAPRLAALLRGQGAEDYLVYPTPIADAQEQFLAFATSNGIPYDVAATWTLNIHANPYSSAQLYAYISNTPPPAEKTGRTLPDGLTTIQYWFFYPFNYLPIVARVARLADNPTSATVFNRDYHQGDWEHIDVILDAAKQPRYVFLAAHNKGQLVDWPTRADAAPAGLELDGTHPVVYSAFGGHGTYARCGTRHRVTDFPVCPRDRVLAAADADPSVFVFRWGSTRMVELDPKSWACWQGLFGYRPPKSGATSLVGPGPKAPLVQEGGACES